MLHYVVMKKIFLLCLAVLCLGACGGYEKTAVTLPDGFVISCAIADTPQKTEKGLMFVKHLPQDEGMLFVFDKQDEQYFWMKNTLIDLDIIFLDAQKNITGLFERVPHTYTYTPDNEIPFVHAPAQYVLEAAAGTITRHGLQQGQRLEFDLPL